MGEWLTLHLKNVAECFMCARGGAPTVLWFQLPAIAEARAALLTFVSQVAAEQQGAAVLRSKVRALPVHQFLRAFPSAVAKGVLKSILYNMTGTSF